MSSWSKRRKKIYATIIVVFFVGVIVIPAFIIFYRAPTCFDGGQNGNEKGVDCGGSCQRLCQNSFLSPSLAWTRFEEVAPSLYNIAAYIVNPNIEGEAINVPYHLVLYDDRGVLITDTNGLVTLPPHRNTLAFQGAVNVGKRIPAKALFEFTAEPNWHKRVDSLSSMAIGKKNYTEDDAGSALTVNVKNVSVYPLTNISIYVVLYDKNGNALGFSKTLIDEIPPKGSMIAPFTWPLNRQGKVISIEVLPVVE
ncbi:MAG: FxLYD domain-containing protein [Patescibacteria group bacterium]